MADLLPCIRWMEPYAKIIQEAGPVELKFFPTVHIDDSHNIQTHAVDLDLLVSTFFFFFFFLFFLILFNTIESIKIFFLFSRRKYIQGETWKLQNIMTSQQVQK